MGFPVCVDFELNRTELNCCNVITVAGCLQWDDGTPPGHHFLSSSKLSSEGRAGARKSFPVHSDLELNRTELLLLQAVCSGTTQHL